MSRCHAFTLAETLAAIAVLAVLAAAAMPLTLRLAQGEEQLGMRWHARTALREATADAAALVRSGIAEVPGHAEWQVRCLPLSVEAGASLTPVRWWWQVVLVDTAHDDRVLAETLITGPAP
ncbi:MAG: prepilin-type N-terminal cleavage/methylation domain-containing protein [Planctomycetes bacterium]|nr:prepilin-type N-terminal cleavage/methylation domain-containing protein [Planctomycetota bacterium]